MYRQNTGLLKKICSKLSYVTDYEFDDLLQQSYFGLVKAAKTYQQGEANFCTYAFEVITRELQRYIDNTASVIRMPVHKNIMLWNYRKFLTEYRTKHNCDPMDFEVCESLQISQKQLESLRMAILTENIKSLSEPVSEDFSETIADTVPDPYDGYEDVEKKILQGQLAEKLWEAVGTLKSNQQDIVKQYYVDELTLQDIAEKK